MSKTNFRNLLLLLFFGFIFRVLFNIFEYDFTLFNFIAYIMISVNVSYFCYNVYEYCKQRNCYKFDDQTNKIYKITLFTELSPLLNLTLSYFYVFGGLFLKIMFPNLFKTLMSTLLFLFIDHVIVSVFIYCCVVRKN